MSENNDALPRASALLTEGKSGVEIARVLHAEGFDIQTARDALWRLGFVVSVEQFTLDVQELHVSNRPMKAGLAVIIASSEPRALPSVVWK